MNGANKTKWAVRWTWIKTGNVHVTPFFYRSRAGAEKAAAEARAGGLCENVEVLEQNR